MDIGRNAPCYCGSGKKFKKCHARVGSSEFPLWRETAMQIASGDPHASAIIPAFFALLDYVDKNDWAGACHAVSSVLYLLLSEQGIPATLWIGEALEFDHYMDHSWITVDAKVYDVAIYRQLQDAIWEIIDPLKRAPVFRGIDLVTGKPTHMRYGVRSGYEDGQFAHIIKQKTWVQYMNAFPGHPDGLWGIASVVGDYIGLTIDSMAMRTKYADTKWEIA